jgi:hypothetical protein
MYEILSTNEGSSTDEPIRQEFLRFKVALRLSRAREQPFYRLDASILATTTAVKERFG